jgi:hypothetical protein
VVPELGDVGYLFEVRTVCARAEYRTKDASASSVCARKSRAYCLDPSISESMPFVRMGKNKQAYVVYKGDTLDV